MRELPRCGAVSACSGQVQIYILDEARRSPTFDLQCATGEPLEEPPDHIVFMMATTQPEDIPQTVRSRCQQAGFHAVKLVDILGELRRIAGGEASIWIEAR